MAKFEVGDRVAVYKPSKKGFGDVHRDTGRISEILPDGILYITFNGCLDSLKGYANPKFCRRLVKKERPRVWVGLRIHKLSQGGEDVFYEAKFQKPANEFSTADGFPWIEFVEVKPKGK